MRPFRHRVDGEWPLRFLGDCGGGFPGKLKLRPDQKVTVVGLPEGIRVHLPERSQLAGEEAAVPDAVLVFARRCQPRRR